MTQHPDLFVEPRVEPRKISKRKLRNVKSSWRAAVEHWAARVLSFDAIVAYADPENTWTYINVDGSGPPNNWRKLVVAGLASDYASASRSTAFLYDATDSALVKAAIRIGRLPRSVIQTMPPKPPELN